MTLSAFKNRLRAGIV